MIPEGSEWLVTNGLGGYASGTVGGSLRRRYHGYLIAALPAPLGRTVLLTQMTRALMLDHEGYVAETTGANVFLVIDGALHTPQPDRFLDGITRRTVIELARRRDYEVIERRIRPEELKSAQEMFVTGTAAELTAVRAVDDLHFQVGPVTKQLQSDFHATTRAS